MATRLTGFSKLMITLAILAVIFFGVRYLSQQYQGRTRPEKSGSNQ